jgi:hypothetical protein
MKTNKLVYGLFGLMALASCSDKMDYSETVVKDKDYVFISSFFITIPFCSFEAATSRI